MNRTRIEWVRSPDGRPGYSWNPVTGCLQGCPYCYARRIAERFGQKGAGDLHEIAHIDAGAQRSTAFPYGFDPTLHRSRLDGPVDCHGRHGIFVCSMGDLLGSWVPTSWVLAVLTTMYMSPHRYYLLTKNPCRYRAFDWPANTWLGTTVTNQAEVDRTLQVTARTRSGQIAFVSCEPLFGPVDLSLSLKSHLLRWVVVGAQTGPGAVKPDPAWVQSLLDQCQAARVPVFVKDNVRWPECIQQFPEVQP